MLDKAIRQAHNKYMLTIYIAFAVLAALGFAISNFRTARLHRRIVARLIDATSAPVRDEALLRAARSWTEYRIAKPAVRQLPAISYRRAA